MSLIHDKLSKTIPAYQDEIKSFAKTYGDKVIAEVTVGALLGGQRGIKSLLCDTSEVPADKGLIIRGIPLAELTDKLPEEIYWLLLTGELPSKNELADFQAELKKRAGVPAYVWAAMEALPKDSHPMAVFNLLILTLERESEFRRRYAEGMKKDEYWKLTLEDSLNLVAKLPELAAGVYRWRYDLGPRIEAKPGMDWAESYAYMMGVEDKDGGFARLMRLYMTLHTDHESGNVSAHTAHCVGSALSDPYYAVSAGLNGLAGPLHGLANQEVLRWLLDVLEKFKGNPSDEQLNNFAKETLDSGRVIPGYGHAVLRVVDPRFTAFMAFGQKECPDSPVFKLAEQVFNVVPELLKGIQKIKDPWPNVDSISGSLLHHYGVTQPRYYTVMFGVSRAMGMTSQLVMSRGWGEAIQRPKSIPFAALKKIVGA
ncbi:MAG: citrate (Si)-synthase [Calditrichaeota bacterium]|nr:citrate (Si)-synthase [Calditrichota bacterium]MCB9367749.1 citrate (Si)-synthase [Calditrichota bacterium]